MTTMLINRSYALGDVILTTPIIRRLRRENPDAKIIVQTMYPDVFRNNPHVNEIIQTPTAQHIDNYIELNLAYERRPNMHIVDAYMAEAFDRDWETSPSA